MMKLSPGQPQPARPASNLAHMAHLLRTQTGVGAGVGCNQQTNDSAHESTFLLDHKKAKKK